MFVIKKLLQIGLTLLAASFLVFVVLEFSPGNVASKTLGEYATDEQKQILYEKLELGDPLYERYARWLGVLVGALPDPLQDPAIGLGFKDPRGDRYFGNFGYSVLYKAPVNDIIWDRLAHTGMLAGLAFAIIVPLAMVLGIVAGVQEGSRIDRSISIVSVIWTSIPEFATAVFLIAIFVVLLGWLPGTSSLSQSGGWPVWSQLILPVLVLVIYDAGYVTRMVRASVIDVASKHYVRTAVLKGLSWPTVVRRHIVRNALITPFTIFLLQINFLISGVVVTEVVFAYPGFGRMVLEAALFGDIALIQAATLVALVVAIVTQIAGDIGAALLDPRVKLN